MKKIKVLIVDDERSFAEMIRVNFSLENFDARACHTGRDALREARENRPDVMILDVMMGDMDGWEVLTHLKADPKTASIPVIMCTARGGPEDIERAFSGGAQSYIFKPVNFPKLMLKIASLIDLERLMEET